MTAPLLNISGKIEPKLVELYAIVAKCAAQLQIPYLVVGASARDMVLHHGYGAVIQRATIDIDFALQVSSWSAFASLREALIANGFSESNREYRFIAPNGWSIDVVPFGGVTDENTNIHWPPSGNFLMNVLGLQEVLENAKPIRIQNSSEFDIPVATPEGITILKFIAWMDREASKRTKDAKDITYLLTTYENIPAVADHLYEDQVLMDLYEWDITLASAHQLGITAKEITSQIYQTLFQWRSDQEIAAPVRSLHP